MYSAILFVLLIIGAATYGSGNYATGYSSVLMIAAQFAVSIHFEYTETIVLKFVS